MEKQISRVAEITGAMMGMADSAKIHGTTINPDEIRTLAHEAFTLILEIKGEIGVIVWKVMRGR